jgi:hypothetical protein
MVYREPGHCGREISAQRPNHDAFVEGALVAEKGFLDNVFGITRALPSMR